MNVNEVISNRAIQSLDGEIGSKSPVHPNDDVNLGQSSNDTFPTAMHIAAVLELQRRLLPSAEAIEAKAAEWADVIKTGRTHVMDATPLTAGQEWSGWAHQIRDALERIVASKSGLFQLAAGGTAVGTGLNAPVGFSSEIADQIAELTAQPFVTAPNKFVAQGALDPMAALRGLAVALLLPENECGSSIMPGKVNPTQCEAMVMVCIQVIGEDNAVAFAGSQGNFELNAMRPIIINNFLHSAHMLGDACEKFRRYSVEGTRLNHARIDEMLGRSLMLVTALSPVIGYYKASEIAYLANDEGLTLKQAALKSGYIDEKRFDEIVDPTAMAGRGVAGR